ncbi:hypothetical protein KI387_027890, partial [Taxus chinensis]
TQLKLKLWFNLHYPRHIARLIPLLMDFRYDSTVPPPCLYSTEDYLLLQREVTQQYHQLIAEQEIGFRDRLRQLHFHDFSSHFQILQPKFNQRSRKILKPKSGQKLQQDSSRSPNSGLPQRRGWCSLCGVDCNTEEVLGETHFWKEAPVHVDKVERRLWRGKGRKFKAGGSTDRATAREKQGYSGGKCRGK